MYEHTSGSAVEHLYRVSFFYKERVVVCTQYTVPAYIVPMYDVHTYIVELRCTCIVHSTSYE